MQNDKEPPGRDLRAWLKKIAAVGELLVIDAEVDPEEELAAITFMAAQRRGAPALLFRRLKGDASGASILANMLGASEARYALAVGLEPQASTRAKIAATGDLLQKRIAPVMVPASEAPVRQCRLVGEAIDLALFPAPKFWPLDGGRYFGTACVTLTRNPENGVINAGVYRQQFHGKAALGLSMVPGRHGLRNCEAAWARGKAAEVTVAFGVDPALYIAATQSFGYDESELAVAGGLTGSPLTLTGADTVDLPIPAQAELVIEGVVRPDALVLEGPLGEWHGYYSSPAAKKPVIEVRAVHHRQSPILGAALMATYPACEIGAYHAIVKSSRILANLAAMGVAGITGAYAHPGAGNAYGLVAIAVKQLHPGHAAQVLALAAQCPAAAYCTKWIVAVDHDVDPTDIDQVLWALTTRANPSDDIDILRHTWSNRNDQSLAPEARPYGSKALINACMPYKYIAAAPPRTLLRRSMYERVADRWQALGLAGEPPQLDNFLSEK